MIGSNWLVSKGLNDGDRLIVEGTNKVAAGVEVKAVEVQKQTATGTANGGEQ
ncbi:Probable efflux pump periplasmic linker ttgA precursor [Serratia plymuthica]|uniref:Probable efflux pump periplasmic linker ttgA n=1 Tax=Serratia plymuthica TaxID=82996 RepID=A0A2X4XTV0_SERPL|nr:Probable efflux pump periplasmic linker ttgA precursor [Serratia plymuthica]